MFKKLKEKYRENHLVRVLLLFIMVFLPWGIAIMIMSNRSVYKPDSISLPELACDAEAPVYHTKFAQLNRDFASAKEVTAACLSCHTERHREIMKTAHWNWEKEDLQGGEKSVYFGKRSSLNNFCIGISGSEQTCTRCHIGYGWKDKSFDFNDPNAIDCLVCHDNTNTYKKAKGMAGFPASGEAAPDYTYIAQHVCSPTRNNCGVCHFWGGGGNNVKHGDLEKALLNCSREVDVHMAAEGADLQCIECHVTVNHNITGRNYSNSFTDTNRVTCEQCHGGKPHLTRQLNRHCEKVSCQACHIPVYAKVNATKMTWDWSTAGKLDANGEPYHEEDAWGNHTYLSIKGDFTWEKNVVPEYVWFNGTADHYILGDRIDQVPLQMNPLCGSYNCNNSKIYPVKVHRGKQIYDPVNNYLIQPKLYSDTKGEGAFWVDFDWDQASRVGMEYVGLDYSGQYDFVETEMFMMLNHMVSGKESSLSCKECHSREGRLEKLDDFYMPGRDRYASLDTAGILLALMALAGVLAHAIIRGLSMARRSN